MYNTTFDTFLNNIKKYIARYRVPILIALGLILLGIGYILIRTVFLRTELLVLVAPTQAIVEIDGVTYGNGKHYIPIGKHKVKISAEGFTEINGLEIEAELGKPVKVYKYLSENGSKYSEEDYELLSIIAEDEETVEQVNVHYYEEVK